MIWNTTLYYEINHITPLLFPTVSTFIPSVQSVATGGHHLLGADSQLTPQCHHASLTQDIRYGRLSPPSKLLEQFTPHFLVHCVFHHLDYRVVNDLFMDKKMLNNQERKKWNSQEIQSQNCNVFLSGCLDNCAIGWSFFLDPVPKIFLEDSPPKKKKFLGGPFPLKNSFGWDTQKNQVCFDLVGRFL